MRSPYELLLVALQLQPGILLDFGFRCPEFSRHEVLNSGTAIFYASTGSAAGFFTRNQAE
jgi:hypothetical protein